MQRVSRARADATRGRWIAAREGVVYAGTGRRECAEGMRGWMRAEVMEGCDACAEGRDIDGGELLLAWKDGRLLSRGVVDGRVAVREVGPLFIETVEDRDGRVPAWRRVDGC